eukprot:gb/GECH01005219.1/.p1 GENE.gb/GECH01005219.1/~~gb/GECH01005219.1/.p1  ORF type:complete len:146 (+),score=37.74 gb/GECH01005219.1/:1-438(+)
MFFILNHQSKNKMGKKKKGGNSSSSSSDKKKGGSGGKKKMGTCNHVKGRHILCAKQSRILEVQKKLKEGWLDNDDKVPPGEFGKLAQEHSECSTARRGGDLGWFPRGKMVPEFQKVAFDTPVGEVSDFFRTENGYHIFLCEGRKA